MGLDWSTYLEQEEPSRMTAPVLTVMSVRTLLKVPSLASESCAAS